MLVFPSHGENLPFSPPETSDFADCGFPSIPQLLTFTKRNNDPPLLLPLASAHPAHAHPRSPSSHSVLCLPPVSLPQVEAQRKSLPMETCYPKMALCLLALPSFGLQFSFPRVALQLSVEFGLPLVASRESMQKNKRGLGVTACFKVSNTIKVLGEALALAVDGFIYMYLFNEGGKRHQ